MRRLERLRQLSLRDWVLLSQLIGCCCAVSLALRVVGWQRLSQSIISESQRRWLRHFPALHLNYDAEHLTSLAEMASAAFRGNRCLVRSMVMLWLLRTRGIAAEVVLGVRKRDGNFEAHAWTRSERGPIGEQSAAVDDFAVLTTSGEL